MRVLVTGGAGYIGSHAVLCLLAAGHDVVVVDNLCNSSLVSIERVNGLAGRTARVEVGDVCDRGWLRALLARERPDAVVHFAGLKAVGESVREPARYYWNNVGGTLSLVEAMAHAGVRNLVFSSSATVYDATRTPPFGESAVLSPINPYGRSKLMAEQILEDLPRAGEGWSVVSLRYFNPVGAHESGRIGEDPAALPNNLMPVVCQAAVGRLPRVTVFGNDYATRDGTGVRDYVHVMDLALGHVAAIEYALAHRGGATAINLGTGRGQTVLEVIAAFEAASGRKVPWQFAARRPGDCAESVADASLAARVLGWRASRTLDDMCRDAWRWQQANPQGYPRAAGA